jgi:hypothetical protein
MRNPTKLPNLLSVPLVFGVLVLGLVRPTDAEGMWQERMLFNPPASQLELEKRGRIVIYDGLKDTQITQAMDTQFDRIQSMMFVRTVVNTEGETLRDEETGTVVIEDDGC